MVESLERWGTTRVVPVGPLLAVLLSLQQGRPGLRSTVTLRFPGHSRHSARYRGTFWGDSSGQIPRPFHDGSNVGVGLGGGTTRLRCARSGLKRAGFPIS